MQRPHGQNNAVSFIRAKLYRGDKNIEANERERQEGLWRHADAPGPCCRCVGTLDDVREVMEREKILRILKNVFFIYIGMGGEAEG